MKELKLHYVVIAIMAIYILFTGRSEEKEIIIPSVENTVKIEDPIPVVRDSVIYRDSKPVILKVKNEVNTELLRKYNEALIQNDSLLQLKLYKVAVTERNYSEVLEDSIQTITVESKVIGTLKSQKISYKTKEQKHKIPVKKLKPSVFIGVFNYGDLEKYVAGGNVSILNGKKNKILTVGYDTEKRVHLGITLKLF